jgi:hypothetical protein
MRPSKSNVHYLHLRRLATEQRAPDAVVFRDQRFAARERFSRGALRLHASQTQGIALGLGTRKHPRATRERSRLFRRVGNLLAGVVRRIASGFHGSKDKRGAVLHQSGSGFLCVRGWCCRRGRVLR